VGHVVTIRFERFTVFKPPALPEVMTEEVKWYKIPDAIQLQQTKGGPHGSSLRCGRGMVSKKPTADDSLPLPAREFVHFQKGLFETLQNWEEGRNKQSKAG